MRIGCLLLALAASLAAEGPYRILGVERRGLPPYRVEDRLYPLELGPAGHLKVGDRLMVTRPGAPRALGRLRVVELQPGRALATFEALGEGAPLKDDLATLEVLPSLPASQPVRATPLPVATSPEAPPKAPPEEGLLYFLPGSAELSPAGRRKLEGWVQAWGPKGRYAVLQAPASGREGELRQQRGELLQILLKGLGTGMVELQWEARPAEGRHDPLWVRHWE